MLRETHSCNSQLINLCDSFNVPLFEILILGSKRGAIAFGIESNALHRTYCSPDICMENLMNSIVVRFTVKSLQKLPSFSCTRLYRSEIRKFMWHLFCIPFPIAHQLPIYAIQSSEFDISLYLMVRPAQSSTEFRVTSTQWVKNVVTLWWISLNKVLYLSYNITFALVNVGFDGAYGTIKFLNYSVFECVHWNCWIYWAIFLWLKYVYFYQVNVANEAHDTERATTTATTARVVK